MSITVLAVHSEELGACYLAALFFERSRHLLCCEAESLIGSMYAVLPEVKTSLCVPYRDLTFAVIFLPFQQHVSHRTESGPAADVHATLQFAHVHCASSQEACGQSWRCWRC